MSEYLFFAELPNDDGRKTFVWAIRSKRSGEPLGVIKWYGSWRQYCFYPERETIWNVGCLSDVEGFIAEAMSKWPSWSKLKTFVKSVKP